jgi:hypothetical protein
MNTKYRDDIERFVVEHGATTANALEVYIRQMEEVRKEAQDGFEAAKDDPERQASQDKSRITTYGLKLMAGIFEDNANRARRTLDALNKLREEGELT